MRKFLFTSHDGYGLGHVRRNVTIAMEVVRRDPSAHVTVLTGITATPSWLDHPRLDVVRVPAVVKHDDGQYGNDELGRDIALARRSETFEALVERVAPDVVVVDRHPYGIDGELRPGIDLARRRGSALVLGLRDILDEPPVVQRELSTDRWAQVASTFDRVLVYGMPHVCDHVVEYGLPVFPTYTGWVAPDPRLNVVGAAPDPHLLVISAGGGADGQAVRRIGVELLRRCPTWRGLLVRGPLAPGDDDPCAEFGGRLTIASSADGGMELYARSGASLQMAGYNSTIEALAAGLRPILVPRRAPRREQAIRSARLASLGLADVVDAGADADELTWLLHRPRRLLAGDLSRAGITLDGAARATDVLFEFASRREPAGVAAS
ncbi:MAG: hypothetical protein R2705_01765 [Ilumatobacteraceae bacterium]